MTIYSQINKLLSGDKRTIRAKKNIMASFGIKICDALVYLLLVPLTLGYLNEYEYGVWLTLSSILVWINSFDIGLGNGLRNKLTEAIAANDKEKCKSYVSTALIMLCIIMGGLMAIGALLLPFVNWYSILGVSPDTILRLNQTVFVAFALFCLNFVLKIIGNVYLALQLPAISNLLVFLGHGISLLLIYILTLVAEGSLLLVAVAYSAAPPLVYAISYPITFCGKYKFMSPSYKHFNIRYLKSLFSMGVLFFIIQLGGLLLFSTANLIISHELGPENVTPFNITQRYFSVVSMCFGLIIAPMWAATTDAYARGDISWIKKTMNGIKRIMLFVGCALIVMVLCSGFIFKIWIGNEVYIPYSLTSIMAIYMFILLWSLAYSNFLNGMGKLRIQAINTILAGISYIPLGLIAGKYFGLIGVVMALCIANISGAILNTIQFNKIIFGKTKGIWLK